MWFTGDDGSNRTIGYATTIPEPMAIGLIVIFGGLLLIFNRNLPNGLSFPKK
jgi:hypothetical protein